MTHWYTADPHFGHDAIIRLCRRPFRSVGHMDAVLMVRLREAVGPQDDLWIVGDLAHGPKARDAAWLGRLFAQLPGERRHLVVGNHDGPATIALPWDTITPMAEHQDGPGRPHVLCHYPLLTWPGARRGALHLFGHVHDNWSGCRGAVNVGVDQWDFRPATITQIAARAAALPPSPLWPDVEPGASDGPPVMQNAVPHQHG